MADLDIPQWQPGGGLHFQLSGQSGRARRGRFVTAHGVVETPAFMPVGTQAAVKCALPGQVADTGADVVLANTYHLGLNDRPQLVERLGGLHQMMGWSKTILTDSGGFQVFSLPDRRILEEGVEFRFRHRAESSSSQDAGPSGQRSSGRKQGGKRRAGSSGKPPAKASAPLGPPMMLTPEKSMEIQRSLGADIVMAFDECVDHKAPVDYVERSLGLTQRWLKRCMRVQLQDHQHLFGIVQGGMNLALRGLAVRQLLECDLPGYAIGGVSVGEGYDAMVRVVDHTAPLMREDRVRYLMGVGLPEDLVASVACGMDIHDCVIPTRYAREGTVFTWTGKMRLHDKRYRRDRYPIDTRCSCPSCSGEFSRAYLRHLLFADEPLYGILATLHNLQFYQDLMTAMREAIIRDRFADWAVSFHDRYLPKGDPRRERLTDSAWFLRS